MTIEIPTIPALLLAVVAIAMLVTWIRHENIISVRLKEMRARNDELMDRQERILERAEEPTRKQEERQG